jgi:hypothetical protein
MAAYDLALRGNDIDLGYFLMRDSPVTLYHRSELLTEVLAQLRGLGYYGIEVDASQWTQEADIRALGDALAFPNFQGTSLDAFHDHMRDVATHEYGTDPQATGTVLVLRGYDHFAQRCPYPARCVLSSFVHAARMALLFGHRMICLVQSDDPDTEFLGLETTSARWNDAEVSRVSRHPPERRRGTDQTPANVDQRL